MVQMRCSSRHCICLSCFRNMCTVKLDNDSFRNFVEFGYSVSCPGPGELTSLIEGSAVVLHHDDVMATVVVI